MVNKISAIDYLLWNDAIAKHFFHEEMAGKEVLLYINEPLVAKLGSPYGVGSAEFVQAVKDGPYWVTRSGFCQKALQAFQEWRSRNFEYPPYVAYLAFFVLAAGTEGDFAVHAYYPRLWKLLGEPEESGTPPSFDRMIHLWDDLEKWSREDKHESIGRFEARIRGNWWKVGLPLSQTLISEDERKHLPVLFNQAGLDPTDAPSSDVILRVLKEYGATVLKRRTYSLLDSRDSGDVLLKDALMNLVIEELEEWDGTVTGEYESEDGGQRGQIHTGLRICLAHDLLANTVKFSVRFKTGKSFPEEGLNFVRSGDPHIWSCTEIHQGWSKTLKDRQFQPPVTLDGAALDWINGERLADQKNKWQAKLRAAATRLFVPGWFEGLPDWIEKQRLERNVEFRIASTGKDIEKIREWGKSSCAEFKEHKVSGLPDGWVLFSGKNAGKSCASIDVLAMSPAIRLLIRGGIKTGKGNAYLKFAPPCIVIENGLGDETVMLNGQELKREDPNIPVWYLPDNAPASEPLRTEVKADGQVFRRILRLETPELPILSNYNSLCRNASGDLCQKEPARQNARGGVVYFPPGVNIPQYTAKLPLHLSEKITFIGERPGEVSDWPREGLPSWPPIWAISRISRKKAKAVFCGTPEQAIQDCLPGEPLADKSLLKRWKEIIWHQRKTISQPELSQLRENWKKYMMVAKDV